MTILVTGATGCLGSRLVEKLLDAGEAVKVFVRSQSQADWLRRRGAEVVVGDLRDDEAIARAMAGVDTVYHCAAYTSEKGSWAEFEESNIRGTERLLAAAAQVRRFVHVSSAGIYSPVSNGKLTVTEADGYDPYPWRRGFYTWSKIEADRIALRHGKRPPAPAVVVIRPGILYGPRAKPFFARAHFSWRKRFTVILGQPDVVLPLTHVDSAVEALLRAGQGRSGEAYNIVDRPVTQAAYLTWLRNGSARSARIWYVPQRLTAALANLLEIVSAKTGKGPKFPRYRLLRAYHGPIYDTTKAERELGWQPKEI